MFANLVAVAWRLAVVAPALLAACVTDAQVAPVVQQPDDQAADMTKPVQVFILLGQSNMLGFGRVGPEGQDGTLATLVKLKGKYPHLVNGQGEWTVRRDVRNLHVMDKRGVGLTDFEVYREVTNDWLSPGGKHIGPEMAFGHIMGHLHDEPVLLLKSCIGNRGLGWDLLPPGSQRFTSEGRTYAGYKETPSSWVEGEPKKEVNWYAGRQYDADVGHAKAALAQIEKYYPGYQGSGYRVAGFVFWQGHKDQSPVYAGRYEQNLVRFIKSLRKDFNAPDAPFVLATIAFGGQELSGPGLQVAQAQLAVSGDAGRYPEFAGNVKTVDARPFWRDKSESPTGAGYHYNHNAETYMEVGAAMGRAMAELLGRD